MTNEIGSRPCHCAKVLPEDTRDLPVSVGADLVMVKVRTSCGGANPRIEVKTRKPKKVRA